MMEEKRDFQIWQGNFIHSGKFNVKKSLLFQWFHRFFFLRILVFFSVHVNQPADTIFPRLKPHVRGQLIHSNFCNEIITVGVN